ncbi:MAG: RNA-binding protein [Sphingobacteriales bacterium]|nr:RNA-binding protein [Sphingobacteriales bacterium]
MKRLHLYFLAAILLASCRDSTLFEKISSSHSGIRFNNKIIETDSINPLDVVNIYNGGGVGVGDFNNDGLKDLYFTGNQVPSKLYLNKGDFEFEDVTDKAGVNGDGKWGRGVAVIDINNDGLVDIYVCNTISQDSVQRHNILYINKGKDKDGIPHFEDMALQYGLEAGTQSTMANFFDYDNDGDLDMYLTVNNASDDYNPSVFGPSKSNSPNPSKGLLYRNDWNSTLNHPEFHDVSLEAGVGFDGFGHAATTVDFNSDGWIDIYVSNDFISANILYINNHDGTFTNRTKEYFKHTSYNSMGQDVVDINNDGLADVIELDMNPEDNYRKKMILGPNSYQTYQNFAAYGIQFQYVRNTLQLNQGPSVTENGVTGNPAFSEISFLSGIAQTDWSWTPLVTDFDNDGYRDIIITNGFPKDVSDRDFMAYRAGAYSVASKKALLEQIPEAKLHNYAYLNNGDLTFKDVSTSWGLDIQTFSNGAVYADLDNDGDMDMVVNNINDEALIYKNTSRNDEKKLSETHYLQIGFSGDKQNINGIGAISEIFYDKNKRQVYENSPFRGYLSTIAPDAHFGLGKIKVIDSVIIRWPGGKKQKLVNVKADQKLKVLIADAKETYTSGQPVTVDKALFNEVTASLGLNYIDKDDDFIDFNIQKLLPHKLSSYSPALAVSDIDQNGLYDIVIGGNSFHLAQKFLQQPDGKFKTEDLYPALKEYTDYKDEGMLLFDANGDEMPDLYIASGGYKHESGNANYQDRFYLNDGKGNFTLDQNALPKNLTSKLCVRSIDFNKDGKLDLFVSGRVDPWNYPKPVSSFILRNDSNNRKVKFTDVSSEVAPVLKNIGMVCDALFTDFNNDNWPDLVLAGEFMPITFLQNNKGKLVNTTATTGISNRTGFWNTIVAGDFRHTGKIDYIVGNVGLNTFYKATEKYPVFMTGKDFEGNGSYAAVPSLFLPDKNGEMKEYPAFGRDDMIKQLISTRKKYTNFKSYASATMDDIFTPEQRENSIRLSANTSASCYIRNDGNGKFTLIPLPMQAQISVLNGMEAEDFDGDGNLDVVINGNDFGTEVSTGRYDALNGLFLKGDGKGGFKPLSIIESGIYLPGNGKALVKFLGSKGDIHLAASENKGPLKVFKLQTKTKSVKIQPFDVSATIQYQNGQVSKQEFYYGSSFLSQSGRFLNINNKVKSISITDNLGKKRMAF